MRAQEKTHRHYDQILWDWDVRVWVHDVRSWVKDLDKFKGNTQYLLTLISNHKQMLEQYMLKVNTYKEELCLSNRAEKQMVARGCDDFLLRETHLNIDRKHDKMKREHTRFRKLHHSLVVFINNFGTAIDQMGKPSTNKNN